MIEKIILIGARRLAVRGIKHFEADFTSLYQIIAGTNGSGKSYLVSELSALPPSPKAFNVGGRKEIHQRFNNKQYVCINQFNKDGGVHNFIVDGVDLNENGTAAMQKELVEKHFGLTQDIFNVLCSKKKCSFTEMDTSTRRKWMIMLSGIDLDLAMSVYNALKTKTRDYSGHVKRLNTKLAHESEILLKDDELDAMERRLTKTREDFDALLRMTSPGMTSTNDLDVKIDKLVRYLEDTFEVLYRDINKLAENYVHPGLNEAGDLKGVIASLTSVETSLNNSLSKLYEEKHTVSGALNKLKEAGAEGLEEYQDVINKLQIEMDAVDAELANYPFEVVYDEGLPNKVKRLSQVSATAIAVLTEMFDNSKGLIDLDRTQLMRNLEHSSSVDVVQHGEMLNRIAHAEQHAKDTKEVECPQCNFLFKPGFRGDFNELAEIKRKETQELLDKALADQKESRDYLALVNHQSAGLQQFELLERHYPEFSDLWEAIVESDIVNSDPKIAINIVNKYLTFYDYAVHRQAVMKSKDQKQMVYDQASQIDTKDLEHVQQRDQVLENEINEHLSQLEVVKREITEFNNLSNILSKVLSQLDSCEQYIELLDDAISSHGDSVINELLEDMLKELKQEMSELESVVGTVRIQKAIVEGLKKTVLEAKFEQDLHRIMTNELSPDDGLIGDMLKNFLVPFSENITAVIDSVWTYPLQVLPCISSKDGLDYKFPIKAYDGKILIPDISEGSDAQVDIINFAFKYMLIKIRQLQGLPLILDEAISKMDEVHRVEMIRVIESMVESNQCSQMFFISHYASQNNSFPNSEICIMDASNIIQLPTIYNKHVKIS